MAKLEFQINKPVDVSEENLTDVVNDLYDCINRLASSTDKFVANSVPKDTGTIDSKIRIINDQSTSQVKISVKVNGQWYTTTALTKEA